MQTRSILKRIAYAGLCAGGMLAGLTACVAGPGSVQTPIVTVADIRLLPSAEGTRDFIVTLFVVNPNDEALELSHVDFMVRLGTEGFVEGRISNPPLLPASGQVRMRTQVGTEFVSSVSRLMAFVQGDQSTLPYEAEGDVVLNTRPPRSLPFTASGRTPLIMSAGG